MIYGLTYQLNEAGKIKIGKKGAMITSAKGNQFRPPKKLDHFQLTTTERDANGDFVVDVALQNKLKESGSAILNENGALVGIPIRLLYNDNELNFPHKYVSYAAGRLSCHGNGREAFKRLNEFDPEKPFPCPCNRLEPGYEGNDKCKPSGTLTCVIDEAELLGQAHVFRTTSINSIKGILGGIELIKTATGGRIAGLPLMLTLSVKPTTTPDGRQTTSYIVSICYRGSMADLRKEVISLVSEEKQFLIGMDDMEKKLKEIGTDPNTLTMWSEDEQDFVEEFFPHAVDVTEQPAAANVAEPDQEQSQEHVKEQSPAETEPEEGPEPEQEDNEVKGALEPAGQYKKIYDNFLNLNQDSESRMAYANRLQKGNLIYWFANEHPEVDIPENIKKPELLDMVKNLLSETIIDSEKNQDHVQTTEQDGGSPSIPEQYPDGEPGAYSLDDVDDIELEGGFEDEGQEIDELDNEAPVEAPATEEKPKPQKTPREWDKSGPIERDQLREIVRLKTLLEKQGVLSPDTWDDQVKYFLDQNGNPMDKAIHMTKTQGENFIKVLAANVKPE